MDGSSFWRGTLLKAINHLEKGSVYHCDPETIGCGSERSSTAKAFSESTHFKLVWRFVRLRAVTIRPLIFRWALRSYAQICSD
jgi:hypothetical protein